MKRTSLAMSRKRLRQDRGRKKVLRFSILLPESGKIDKERSMNSFDGWIGRKIIVLQDRKRLPQRFSARISGALNSLLS
ncbi:hypothetical protein [Phyllobacterium salinisoli]|uniref:hypothetical protein n=1 Tax=Phyllobacterium salinisoli TaxID=1899321 RepID=UPI0011C04401|nr:hypothetical protein [Phyllobacterium salinisoli]